MYIEDDDVYQMMVKILGVQGEHTSIAALNKWIEDEGLEVVFKRVIELAIDF